MKKSFMLLAGFFVILFSLQVGAQSSKAGIPFSQRFWYGVSLGNIGISNYYATIGLGPMGGIKITDNWAIGATYKLNYTYIWQQFSGNAHVLDHGPGILTKYKFFGRKYFLHAEYDYLSMGQNYTTTTRQWYPFAYIGGGMSGGDPDGWTSEWSILYNIHPSTNAIFFPLTMSYAFIYNF